MLNKIKYLIMFCGLICGLNIYAQGPDCGSATPAIVGLNTADGPSAGGGAEAFCEGTAATNADWYTYTAGGNASVTIESCLGLADTRVHVYDGSCAALSCVTSNDDDCLLGDGSGDAYASSATFAAISGTTYYIQWDDRWSTSGFDWTLTESPIDCPVLLLNIGDLCDFAGTDDGVVSNACECVALTVPDCATSLSPAQGDTEVVIDPVLQLTWINSGFQPNTGVNIYLGTDPLVPTFQLTTAPGAEAQGFINVPAGVWYWAAVPVNALGEAVGCPDLIEFTTVGGSCLATAAPDCPTLVAPADGAIDVPLVGDLFDTVNLSWTNAAGGDERDFNGIYLSNDPDPATLVFLGNAGADSTNIDLTGVQAGLTYYWSVVPSNCVGEATGCSVFSFTVAGALDCPELGLNFGNPCDDGDATTFNDVVADDVCVCAGTPIAPNAVCGGATPIGEGTFTGNTIAGGAGASDACFAAGNVVDAIWFEYTPSCDGDATIESCLGGADTRLSVYDNCVDLTCVASDDDTCPFAADGSGFAYASSVTFPVLLGETFLVEWDDRWSVDTFDFTVSILCDGIDTDGDGVFDVDDNCIDDMNADQADLDADGQGDVCDADIDGDGVDNAEDCAPFDAAVFEGATCDDGDATTANDVIQADCSCSGLPIPSNAVCGGAIGVSEGTYTGNAIIGGAGAANLCFADATNALWYSYTPSCDGDVTIASCLGGADTRLSVYTGGCATLVCVASDDDTCTFAADGSGFAYASSATVAVTAGTEYLIEWDDRWSTDAFDFEIGPAVNTCPTDLSGDGTTDGEDFSLFLGNFGLPCAGGCPCASDFSGDLFTDGEDFSLFLGNFGLDCPPTE